MAALRSIEKIGDRAEEDDQPLPKEGKHGNEDHRQDREDQGVFDQCLAVFAARPGPKCPKVYGENSSHERWNLTTKGKGKTNKESQENGTSQLSEPRI